MRLSTWLAITFLGCLGAAASARAQQPAGQETPPAATPAPAGSNGAAPSGAAAEAAREHFKRGEAAYEKGNYSLAVSEWQTAYSSDPRPRIQYNIYQALERLGQLPEAAEALQRYLSTADPDDPYYADATARAAALQQRLQATGIRLVGGVEGASINVSGHDWGRLPRPDKIPVQPGNHRIVITLAGYKDFVANVIVPAAQVVDVPVQLEALSSTTVPPPPSSATPGAVSARAEVGTGGGNKAMPFFITSAALGAGTVLSAIWLINRASELKGCNSSTFYCKNKSTVSTQRTIAIGTTAALGAGAIGTLIYALVLSGQSSESSKHAALCLPTESGATCGLAF